LRWYQWTGAVLLFLSLLGVSGWSVQRWLAAGAGNARLSIIAETGSGTRVSVEESGAKPATRVTTCCVARPEAYPVA
jgi:hypothetical protein